jgi:heterodisulfide reductase subunit A
MPAVGERVGAVLVVGGGVAGMRAAYDLAEAGLRVYLVEVTPALGGKIAQLGFMFPSHDCVLCRGTAEHGYGCTRPTISYALLDHSTHPNIQVMTLTEVRRVEGEAGHFRVLLRHFPRHVDVSRCTSCGECSRVCPVELPSEYQLGMGTRKAAYKVSPRTAPNVYLVDKGPYCEGCGKCQEICPTGAINLEEQPSEETVDVGAIILAPGFTLYNPALSEELGFGRYPNVVTSLQFERLVSRSGPTEGFTRRPSDGRPPKKIAWLQCVGSRDQQHGYCSSICCMYATKEAVLARQRDPETECRIFTMDERTFNKEYNAYFIRSRDIYGVQYTRCRISNIREDPETQDLLINYQDEAGQSRQERFDLVVLSVGSEPPLQAVALARELGIELNEYGFCLTGKFTPVQTSRPGVYVAGAFSSPKEIAETVAEASAAAAACTELLAGAAGTQAAPVYPPERDVSAEPARVGVLVCRCGNEIGGVVDTAAVAAYARILPGVVHVDEIDYACIGDAPAHIEQVIAEQGLNRVVIAACSPRTHEAFFQKSLRRAGLNPYLLEMVNIRAHCAWAHREEPAAATRQAREMVRVAAARARLLEAVHRTPVGVTKRALVIGGGMSGINAALAIAAAGYPVTLVERSSVLGGHVRQLYATAEGADPQAYLFSLVHRVLQDPLVTVYLDSELLRHNGFVGNFRSTIEVHRSDPAHRHTVEVEHGVTIVATGGQEFHGPVYLLGQHERVMTQQELERLILVNPGRIAQMNTVVMIQCVRPPDAAYDYCSRICCTNTVKNAVRIKRLNPRARIYVLYKDIITYGFREQYYTDARRQGVVFVRYDQEHPPLVEALNGQVQVRVTDPSLGDELVIQPDAVALSMSIEPDPSTVRLSEMLGVPLSPEGFFMEAHIKLRPIDFLREGIFLCGMAHYPKFIEEAIAQAQGTAGRALTILSRDVLEVGGVAAIVDQTKCVGCLTCVRVCPFDVPVVDPMRTGVGGIQGAAYIEPGRCQGCGTCTGECPAKAIQLTLYRDEQIVVPDMAVLGVWLPEERQE